MIIVLGNLRCSHQSCACTGKQMFDQTCGVLEKRVFVNLNVFLFGSPSEYSDSIPQFHWWFFYMNSEPAFHTHGNSLFRLQWLIGIPYATTFMGCIGKDRFGEILEEKVHEAGVKSAYKYVDNEPTGTCAVCITEKHRSGKRDPLVWNLKISAREFYSVIFRRTFRYFLVKNLEDRN